MKRRELADKHCSVARASSQIVDGWTFVILRELFLGNRRFGGLEKLTGMSPRSLTLRLRKLVEVGVLERPPTETGAPGKEYTLTEKGHDLWPVLITLKQWGDDWCGPWEDDTVPLVTMHRGTDHEMRAVLVCETCSEPVSTRTTKSLLSPEMRAERDKASGT